LKADADALFELSHLHAGIVAEDFDFAAGARPETFEDLDGSGFAGAVGAEQAEDLAGSDLEVNTADGVDVAVGFAQAAHGDYGSVHWFAFYCAGWRCAGATGIRRGWWLGRMNGGWVPTNGESKGAGERGFLNPATLPSRDSP